MPKSKRSPKKQKAKVVVQDLQPDKSEPKGGATVYFNPKEITIDKPAPWKK